MAKNMNSGYVGRRHSKRADKAIENGELPLSMITRKRLEKAGITHSPQFIAWLCRGGYLKPTSYHHRGNPPTLTKFYRLDGMKSQLECLAVDMLLDEWMQAWLPKNSQKERDCGEEQSEPSELVGESYSGCGAEVHEQRDDHHDLHVGGEPDVGRQGDGIVL